MTIPENMAIQSNFWRKYDYEWKKEHVAMVTYGDYDYIVTTDSKNVILRWLCLVICHYQKLS